MGTPSKKGNYFDKNQQPLYQQYQNAMMNQGAGGASGAAADYYRDLLSNDSQTYNQMAAPEMRQFNEEIIPGLSEQFAGMGSGGLSSSGFRNAAVGAGTDLSERLGAMRAQLRAQGAQGLSQMSQFGLQDFSTVTPGQAGFFQQIAPAAGKIAGNAADAYFNQQGAAGLNKPDKGTTSPYGNPESARGGRPNYGGY